MLDNEETPTATVGADVDPDGTVANQPVTEPVAEDAADKSPARKAVRRTRKAAAPAAIDQPSTDEPAAPAPAPRKRAPRKVAAAEVGDGDSAAPPVKKRARKAAAKVAGAEGAVADPSDSTPTVELLTDSLAAATDATVMPAADADPLLTPAAELDTPAPSSRARRSKATKAVKAAKATETDPDDETDESTPPVMAAPVVLFQAPPLAKPSASPRKRAAKATALPAVAPSSAAEAEPAAAEDSSLDESLVEAIEAVEPTDPAAVAEELEGDELREVAIDEAAGARRRRRRGRRGRGRQREEAELDSETDETGASDAVEEDEGDSPEAAAEDAEDSRDGGGSNAARRRRRRRRADASDGDVSADDPPNTVVHVRDRRPDGEGDDGVRGVKGSTRLEAKRQRRRDGRDSGRRRPSILSEAEFLARRESVDRVMAVRQSGDRTQIAVLEDGVLVEHYVTRASATSYVGNVYLGRVQNVLPSMEAAFVDIGKGRNGVLYAGEVNWDAAGLEGKSRAIEHAMRSGDAVLVQVTKDPIGHKGARLTSQISLPGRFLVYVPGGGMTGISRRLPDTERQRLKAILKKIVPEDAGVIIRTAAEGASEEELTHDVERLKAEWESITAKAEQRKNAPALLHGEPDLATRVVRDVFNEDFNKLVVQGDDAWNTVSTYLADVAPDLAQRASRHTKDTDLFRDLRVDEGLAKALDRKVWLPSGGSLVIDRTEAMTVIDVNTGKFVGSGGNLEQTVTRNNLEAAEEIVRQLRLRDVGGIVVIDFIDMVLESNRDLVLRRLTECLGRDRTKHQVAEVTSLGLVQMTRKRVGEGLLEAFSEPCEVCRGRGVIIHTEPVEQHRTDESEDEERPTGRKRGSRRAAKTPDEPADSPEEIERRRAAASAMAAIHRAAHAEAEDIDGEPIDGQPIDGEVIEETSTDSDSPAELATPAEPAAYVTTEPTGVLASTNGVNGDRPSDPERAEVGAAPRPARRRRAASRPAGPPVHVR